MSECPYCQNTFEMTESCSDEFRMWQGLVGPYYIPSVDGIGTLTWTNTGELPNPDPVNISASAFDIVGIVETTGDLPESANDFDVYLVGEEEPFSGYIWDGSAWVDLGVIGKGDPGEGVPPGGTTGQVLAKASGTDYDTQWVDQSGGDPATATPLMDGTAAVGTSTKYARSDHVHPLYNQFVRPNLLDNWYFVGGGSQQGDGQFPINQRGQTTYTGSGYSLDRWKNENAHCITTISADGLSVVTNNSSNWANTEQYFENPARLLGKKITLSMLTTANELKSATATIPSSFPSSTTTIASFTPTNCAGLTFRINASKIFLRITTNATSLSAKIVAIKLELGDTQTLAHQENGTWVLNEIPNFADELARCKYYYQMLNFDGYKYVAPGVGASVNDIRSLISLSPGMRTPATVTATGSFSATRGSDGQSTPGLSLSTSQLNSGNQLTLVFTKTGEILANYGYTIITQGGTNRIYISADL